MKKILYILLILPGFLFAQNPPTLLWTEYYGGDFSDSIQTIVFAADGSLIMGGHYKPSEAGKYDLYLLKVDTNGQIIWEMIYPGSVSNNDSERVEKIIQSSDGNFVALIDVLFWDDYYGCWLMKFDTDGNILWIQEYYGYYNAIDLIETDDLGFLIVGNGDIESIFAEFWVLSVNENGNFEWNYENDPYLTLLFSYEVKGVLCSSENNSYLISMSNFNNYGIVEINNLGEIQNIQTIEFAEPLNSSKLKKVENEFAFLTQQSDSNEIEINIFNDSGFQPDPTIIELDNSQTGIVDFAYDSDVGYLFLGIELLNQSNNYCDLFLAQADTGMALLWEESFDYDYSDSPRSLIIYDINNFFVGGIIWSFNSAFLSKFEFNNTSIENDINSTNIFNLQNHPNPFNPSTTISFDVKQNSEFATIEIYNLKGQKVKTFPNLQINQSSIHNVTWNGADENNNPVSSGVYLYKLNVDDKTEVVRKCILLK